MNVLDELAGATVAQEEDVDRLIQATIRAFPREAVMVERVLVSQGYGSQDRSCNVWLTAFAEVTTGFLKLKKEQETRAQLRFMSDQLGTAKGLVKKAIYVCYVENLRRYLNLNPAEKKWAWTLMPDNFREYCDTY